MHEWRTDLNTNATGDLAISTEHLLGQQRILRRLLTNPNDYIWHLEYGGGLGAYIGSSAATTEIAAIVKSQMSLETAVSQWPEPVVVVTAPSPSEIQSVCIQIQYQDSQLDTNSVLTFSLNSATL